MSNWKLRLIYKNLKIDERDVWKRVCDSNIINVRTIETIKQIYTQRKEWFW